jgi:hypothetical protein
MIAFPHLLILPLILMIALLGGCSSPSEPGEGGPLLTRAYPPGGTYPISRLPTIRLASNRPARIYLTFDGTIPDIQKADPLRGPTYVYPSPVSGIPIVNIRGGMVLRFFAVGEDGEVETMKTEQYFIDGPPISEITPPCGSLFNRNVTAVITTSEPAIVYYTTDGSDPSPDNPAVITAPSPVGPIPISQTTEIRFYAVDSSGNQESEIHRCIYTLDKTPPISRATPRGGNYTTVPLSVKLEITNDSGILYYTTNGAIPRQNDPQGHTQIASIQTTLNLTESTVLRFFSVDKAGNVETPPGGYHEEVYILNDEIALIATPPGGSYQESTLLVELRAYPPQATIEYSLNGAPFTIYTAPISIATRDAELRFYAILGAQTTPIHIERYELGVGGSSLLFTEEFTATTYLDMTQTTALVDLSQGRVVLPKVPVVPGSSQTHPYPQGLPQFQAGIRLDPTQPGVIGIVDGVYNLLSPGSPPDTAGARFYAFDSGGTNPTLTYQGMVVASGSIPQYLGLELIRSGSGSTPLAILIPATSVFPSLSSARLDFYDLTTPSSPSFLTSIPITTYTGQSVGPPLILGRKIVPDGSFLVNERAPNQKLVLYQVTGTSATLTITRKGEISLPSEGRGIALDPQDPNRGFILLGNCSLLPFRIETDLSLTPLTSTTVCAGGDIPTGLTALRLSAILYLVGVYQTPQGRTQGVAYRFSDGATRSTILPLDRTPAGIVYTPVVLFESLSTPVLALPAQQGAGVFFYDLNDLPSVFAGTKGSLTFIQSYNPPDSVGGGVGWDPNPLLAGDEILFLKLYNTANPRGGIMAVRVPQNLREEVDSARVVSKDINPQPGKPFQGIRFMANQIQGDVSFEISYNGSSWSPFNCCQSLFVDPPRTTLYYRATLRKGGSSPSLDSLTFRFDYP